MGEVHYTVGVTFRDAATAQEWLAWLRDGHIAEVLQGGATAAVIVQMDGAAEDSGLVLEVRYRFPSRIAFATYMQNHAPRLRAEGLARFPVERGIAYHRTVGVALASFPPASNPA